MSRLPDLHSLERPELWVRVHESLRDAIIAGELEPGMRLVEEELAAKLGVSRWPVRQAITRLEQERLVARHPHRGAYVTALELADVHEVHCLRALLECHAAKEGAARVTPEHLAHLRALVAEHIEAARKEDYVRYARIDSAFHHNIILLANSERLLEMWHLLLPTVQVLLVMGAHADPDLVRGIQQRHEIIIQALATKDPVTIEAAIRQHIVNAEGRAMRRLRAMAEEKRKD
jgi:DNA-binding GntR family transcriptional regulator